jgi:hypothetical protein
VCASTHAQVDLSRVTNKSGFLSSIIKRIDMERVAVRVCALALALAFASVVAAAAPRSLCARVHVSRTVR